MMCNVVRSERTSEGAFWRGFVEVVLGIGARVDRVAMRSVRRARGVGRVVVDIAGDWASQV